MSVALTPAHRDAIFEEIVFAFDCAGDLPFMLDHGAESPRDRDDARDLVSRLHVAVGLLDQLGWQRKGDRERYVLEVDEAVDWFAARIESFALAGLEYNRPGLFAGDDRVRARTQRLIDADLEKLRAARVVRAAFRVARELEASATQSPRTS
jgi:hypothetical protein